MSLNFNIVWLAGSLLFGFTLSSDSQTPVFDQLKERFEEGEIFVAEFEHEYLDGYTGEVTEAGGSIWIAKGTYRVQSEDQVMVVDGDVSRVYDQIRNRLLISEYIEEEDDFAPSRMLQGVDESYSIEENSNSGNTRVTLESDDPFVIFDRVQIRLNGNGIPEVIEAVDQADNRLTTRFREGAFRDFDPSLFEIDVPENAERIDLRH
ncbi:MAG: outer-membrane lipoprotein carrier protein LolA [Balneolaceae bacterium]